MKAFSPVLRDIPHYNRTPSLKVDHKRKLKPIPDREYIIQEEIYKQNVEPAERRNNMSPSFANVLGHTPTYCHQGTPTGNEKYSD